MTTEWSCPACVEFNGDGVDLAWPCGHTPKMWELARAFAVCFQAPEPTDEQIGYFIDDADCVIGKVGPGPWTIINLDVLSDTRFDVARYTSVMLVNGRHILAIDVGEGQIEAHYVASLPDPAAAGGGS